MTLFLKLQNWIQKNQNSAAVTKSNKKRRVTTFDCSSLTNVTPLNDINNQIKSSIFFEIFDDDNDNNEDRDLVRPPPLMVLSQTIQARHPEQLTDTRLNNLFSSIKDLPKTLANYSFFFYGFTSMFVFQK